MTEAIVTEEIDPKNPFAKIHWNQAKRFATANGHKVYARKKAEVLAELWEAFPAFIPEEDAPGVTRYMRANPHTRDATEILDQDGNKICLVFRLGREIEGVKCELPMAENVERILTALRKLDA